ncbi:MAG: hypothetical protein QOE70_5537 [Chthoniobacter sp.]|jgi:hypothetical protein|nr:hypothetical protein [Chthoniobacter sp.]
MQTRFGIKRLLIDARWLALVVAWGFIASARGELLIPPSGGTVLWGDDASYDDLVMGGRSIGFDFSYFGSEGFTNVAVTTNGNLVVIADGDDPNPEGAADYENLHTPSALTRVSPLWDDLEVMPHSGDAVIEKTNPGKWYSVTWMIHERKLPTTHHVFQVVLFGDAVRLNGSDFAAGDIVFSYQEIGGTFDKRSATVGLDAGDEGTFAAPPGLTAPSGVLPESEAKLLPIGRGGFILFRPDENGEYVSTVHINAPPVAVDDMRYTVGKAPFEIDALINDSDPDHNSLTIESVTQGVAGTVSILPNGKLAYTPGEGFVGTDTFTYTISDGHGLTGTARVLLFPFAIGVGSYDGIISDAPTEDDPEPIPTQEGSGYLKLTLGANGAVTGTLKYGGFARAIRGAFDVLGNFSADFPQIVDEEMQIVSLRLHLDLTGATNQIAGTVTDGDFFSNVAAGRSRFTAKAFPAPQAGTYNVLLPLAEDSDGPLGIGYAQMKVKPTGYATLVGKLGDGRRFTAGLRVKSDGTLPFYVTVAPQKGARSGSLSGMLKFHDLAKFSDCDGTLNWFMPDIGDVSGFTADVAFAAELYLPPDAGVRLLTLPDTAHNAQLIVGSNSSMLTLSRDNQVIVEEPGDENLALTINPVNGTFKGSFAEESFDDPPVLKKRTFRGVFLRKQNRGGGLFVGSDGSDAATIMPPEEE